MYLRIKDHTRIVYWDHHEHGIRQWPNLGLNHPPKYGTIAMFQSSPQHVLSTCAHRW